MVAFSKVSMLFGAASAGRIASEGDENRFKITKTEVEGSPDFLSLSQKSAEAIMQSADDTINDPEFFLGRKASQFLSNVFDLGHPTKETSLVQAPRGNPGGKLPAEDQILPEYNKAEGKKPKKGIKTSKDSDDGWLNIDSDFDASPSGSEGFSDSQFAHLTDHTIDTDFSSGSDGGRSDSGGSPKKLHYQRRYVGDRTRDDDESSYSSGYAGSEWSAVGSEHWKGYKDGESDDDGEADEGTIFTFYFYV